MANRSVIEHGIQEFVARDWAAARKAKNRYWAERIARLGASESFRVSEQLRQQALLHNPTWPDESQRRKDLAAHARLSKLFRRAG